MSELVRKLIAENRRTKATFLDLRNCGLTEVPAEVGELVWLEGLSSAVPSGFIARQLAGHDLALFWGFILRAIHLTWGLVLSAASRGRCPRTRRLTPAPLFLLP